MNLIREKDSEHCDYMIKDFFIEHRIAHLSSIAFTIIAPTIISILFNTLLACILSFFLCIFFFVLIECFAFLNVFLMNYKREIAKDYGILKDTIEEEIKTVINQIENNEKKCHNKLDKILTHFILGSGSGLDMSIRQAKKAGNVKWLIAKFLSKKLKRDFDTKPRQKITFSGFNDT